MSVERVASGTGLVNVYNFLTETFPERVDKAVHEGEKMSEVRIFDVERVPHGNGGATCTN